MRKFLSLPHVQPVEQQVQCYATYEPFWMAKGF
jgi:hypothetical protein